MKILENLKHRLADPAYRKKYIMGVVMFIIVMAMAIHAWAGSDSTFDTVVQWLANLLQGSGGKLVGLLGLAIALIGGVVRGSLIGLALGLGLCVASIYGPNILMGMFSAVF
jgi:conjugal transfer pilus assembly protein TraA